MVKISYCSLEEAFGDHILSKTYEYSDKKELNNENKKNRVYKEHFDNSQSPIDKVNNESESDSSDDDIDDEEIMELKRKIEEKKIKRKENKNKSNNKIQLISKDTVEKYTNQMIDDNQMIDIFVLFILGILIIYVLDYFFKLGLGK